jgi:hypothetical protein
MVLAFVFSAMGLAFAPSSALAATEGHAPDLGIGGVTSEPGQYLSGDAIPPYPENPDPDNYSAYLIGEPTTEEITVTFIIEAGNAKTSISSLTQGTAFRKEMPVSLTGTDAKTITSVLMAVDADPASKLAFFDEFDNTFGTSSQELKTVVLSDTYYSATWEAGQIGFDGWEYRINDWFPTQPLEDDPNGYRGPFPYDTPVYDGDIIHFFYDFPSDINPNIGHVEANYVRAKYVSFDSTAGKLKVQLQGHKVYIDPLPPYIMSVFNYVNLGSGTIASLYAADGTTLLQAGQPSWADGTVTFTNNSLAPGTYIVKTVPAYYYTTGAWGNRVNTAYFTQTGSYSKVTIQ